MSHLSLVTAAALAHTPQPGVTGAGLGVGFQPIQGHKTPLRADPLVPTVFHNEWWLNAVTGGDYQVAEVKSGSRTVAKLPYVVHRRFGGHTLCTVPELTHFLGPAVDAGTGSAANRSLKHYQISQELLPQLARFSAIHHRLHRGVSDTFAFQDAGCATDVQFTYDIAPNAEAEIWRGMRDKTRNVIRRAAERHEVVTLDEPGVFPSLYEANLRARGLRNNYTRIWQACAAAAAHGQGQALAVRDEAGAMLGATFTIWDQEAAYHWLATRTPGADNGVMSLLVWHAIRHAAAKGLVFDFDGVGTPGSRLFYTGFGGQIAPRYIVSRYSDSYRALKRGLRAVKRLHGMIARRVSPNVAAP